MASYPKNLMAIQKALDSFGIDGWLFYDVANRDPIAYQILSLDPHRLTTRRWYYLIPRSGSPVKLVHKIERERLAELTGSTMVYASWFELQNSIAEILRPCKKIAMQYSPSGHLFTISYVDAGTVELIRSFGVEVISSANLIQLFIATIGEQGIALHKEAGIKVQNIKDEVFNVILEAVKSGRHITEYDAQQFILERFAKENLTCEGLNPIVALNSHAADPHFEPTQQNSSKVQWNDRILIDLWAKVDAPAGVYYDITWCAYLGANPPQEYVEMFDTVVHARNLAKSFISEKLKKGEKVFGWQVDDICRSYISSKGYGDYFTHRTGHSIDTRIHGSGVDLDNFESRDEREIIPGVCFSIEPGIYKRDVGVRSEISVLIDNSKNLIVVGKEQEGLVLLH